MITADSIRGAIGRLEANGQPHTMRDVAAELKVKTIELEPLVRQMYRDGQLDEKVDHIPDPSGDPTDPGARTTVAARDEVAAPEPGVEPRLARHGGLSYLHIPAVDPQESAAFYEQVFGWDVTGHDTDRPSFSDGGGHVNGAWMTGNEVSSAPGLLPYIYVDHIDETVDLVEVHGGQIVDAPAPDGNLLVATFADPAGNVIGLWQEQEIAP